MNDKQQPETQAEELDDQALDEASGGKKSVWKDGNVTGDDDWEKHNV